MESSMYRRLHSMSSAEIQHDSSGSRRSASPAPSADLLGTARSSTASLHGSEHCPGEGAAAARPPPLPPPQQQQRDAPGMGKSTTGRGGDRPPTPRAAQVTGSSSSTSGGSGTGGGGGSSVWSFFTPFANRSSVSAFFSPGGLSWRQRRRRRKFDGGSPSEGCAASEVIDSFRCAAIDLDSDEWEDRMLIEDVHQDVWNGIVARYKEEALQVAQSSVWDGRSLTVTGQQVRNALLFFFRQMYARLRRDFVSIFPQGISGGGLNASDVAMSVASLLIIDMAITDDDIESFAFTVMPGQRVSLSNCPIAKRYLYFVFMAFKCTTGAFKHDVERFRRCVVQQYLDRHWRAPEEFQLPLVALNNAVATIASAPTFITEQVRFHAAALALERQLRLSADCATDMSVTIDFQKCDEIGRGANGVVYSCVNTATGEFLALKQQRLGGGAAREQAIRAEINMLRQLHHPNVIRFIGCSIDPAEGVVSILMEFAQMSLRDIIDRCDCGRLDERLAVRYGRKILQGLAHLHDLHLIHGDTKSSNVLVTEAGEVKISDFGTAFFSPFDVDATGTDSDGADGGGIHQRPAAAGAASGDGAAAGPATIAVGPDEATHRHSRRGISGTPLFLSPERVNGCAPSEASDMWAFGCVLIEMLSGKLPWWEVTEAAPDGFHTLEAILFHIATTTQPPWIPADISVDHDLAALVRACLSIDPCARPTAHQALEALTAIDVAMHASSSTGSSAAAIRGGSAPQSPVAWNGSESTRVEVHSMWVDDTDFRASPPVQQSADGGGVCESAPPSSGEGVVTDSSTEADATEHYVLQPVPAASATDASESLRIKKWIHFGR